MSDAQSRIPDEELAHLAEFLESDEAGEEALDISQLDGFLTALAVGPARLSEEAMWPLVFGPRPHFRDAAQRERLEGVVRQRLAEIVEQVAQDPDNWAPIFYEAEDGEVLVGAWCSGFVAGMEAARETWLPLLEDEEGFLLLLPILVVASDGELAEELELDVEEVAGMMEQAPDLVPGCVLGIREFFDDRAAGGPQPMNG